jgi:hypothetical protein
MAKRKRQSTSIQQCRSVQPYDVGYFAHKHDISLEQARELMRKIGRDKLNEAAAKLFRR